MTGTAAALTGLRVLDLSRVLAGPWATQTLADLGAEVIKIEHPIGGDDSRKWGPPFIGGDAGTPDDPADAAYFTATNRNKSSVAIDFSKPEGSALVARMARDADILVENFRPGALAKYGLDPATLMAANPRLIYCSITAFGQEGPYRHRPGYDFAMQARGGLMSITGQPDGTPGAEPMKVGVAVTDMFTGMYAVAGILAAVQARHTSGVGQHIDLALFDAQVAMLANQAANYLVGGMVPKRMGNTHPNVVGYQVFAVADGFLALAIGNDAQFRRCCRAMGLQSLADNPDYSTNAGRAAHRKTVIDTMAARFMQQERNTWLDLIEAADVPCAPINNVDQVFADPQAQARGIRVEMPHATGSVSLVASPLRMSGTPVQYNSGPPQLGQHTDHVLSALGLDEAQLQALHAAGVIGKRRRHY
ncbi:CaiB/BaiF CoA-transferase family protein [Acidisphaera sp. L21]|uniref:CaiB/BaiF CoA transferase family protein n=1 Tax=Acidisphaera sp. L21 TaxID=1641851 RepID=UPI00131C63AE|nr:CaiB/BaiF CoA-transferase family protein [Acidisphaera sp. L21]